VRWYYESASLMPGGSARTGGKGGHSRLTRVKGPAPDRPAALRKTLCPHSLMFEPHEKGMEHTEQG